MTPSESAPPEGPEGTEGMQGAEGTDEARHSIRVVAGRTGLSTDAIRAWERRYDAVRPRRSASKRRLYSDGDVERLLLLRRVIAAGRRIGDVARLSHGELLEMVRDDEAARSELLDSPGMPPRRGSGGGADWLSRGLAAIEVLDAGALEGLLSEATLSMSSTRILDEVIMPLLRHVGERWRAGELRPVHEHFATAMLRSFLGNMPVGHSRLEGSPLIVIATPAGQLHELGALGAAVTAGVDGWRPLYLGASLPAEDIAHAVRETGARVVALSIVFPPDDARLVEELHRLRQLLPDEVHVLAGGAGAAAYRAVLAEFAAREVDDFAGLRDELARLRGR